MSRSVPSATATASGVRAACAANSSGSDASGRGDVGAAGGPLQRGVLGGVGHRQPGQRAVRLRAGGVQQRGQMAGQPLDGLPVEQGAAVVDESLDTALGVLAEVDLQVPPPPPPPPPPMRVKARSPAKGSAVVPGERRRAGGGPGHVLEDDLGQRVAGQVALRDQPLHQVLERHVLVGHLVHGGGAGRGRPARRRWGRRRGRCG